MHFTQQLTLLLWISTALISPSLSSNPPVKRELPYFDTFDSFSNYPSFAPPAPIFAPHPHIPVPSAAEIASAIQAAKEASANVMSAQERVQDAKAEVLHQQHVANHKRTQAALAQQKAEAAAAVAQQEAKAAANGLIQAQQRLAHAKAEVADLQKIASLKEGRAAGVIQKSAVAAAVEVQRNDDAARKLSALQHSNSVTLRQAAAGKEGTISATSAAVAAESERGAATASSWAGASAAAPKFVHLHPWG